MSRARIFEPANGLTNPQRLSLQLDYTPGASRRPRSRIFFAGGVEISQNRALFVHFSDTGLANGCWGGEEFIAALVETDCVEAEKVAERIRRSIEDAVFYLGHGAMSLHLTVSVGLAACESPSKRTTVDALIGKADRAMYQAKRSGKNSVCVSTDQEEALNLDVRALG